MMTARAAVSDRSLAARFGTFYSIALRSQRSLENILYVRLTVYEIHRSQMRRRCLDTVQPCSQLPSVCMRAVPVDDLHLCPQWRVLSINPDARRRSLDPAAQGALSLIADKENRILRVASTTLKVMQNPAGFHHPGRCDDHHRAARCIQRLGLFDAPRKMNLREFEEVLRLVDEILGVIKHLRMHLENRRCVNRERTVNINRNFRDCPLTGQTIQIVQQLLRTTDGKRWNQNPTAARRRFPYYGRELHTRVCC